MTQIPRILVIDDERIICLVIKETLEPEGMIVDCAENGIIGLAKIQDEHYDLVILDIKMPHISGMDLLKSIQKFDKRIITIMTTGYAIHEVAEQASKIGAIDYLPKPFTPEELRSAVHRGLELRNHSLEKGTEINEPELI
jgi:DNA-binding NtrC family response regulator